jgi:hypothetical protein
VIAEVEPALRQCIKLLEDALTRPPAELESEVDDVERQLAQVRDRLIEQVHAPDAQSSDARQALDRVNAALSLVVGVEYPASGIQRKLLTQARGALKELLEE